MNGNVFFPLRSNSKIPSVRWTEVSTSIAIPQGANVGMRCLASVVIDTDHVLATELALMLLPKTKKVKTRKGMHFYFSGTLIGKRNLKHLDIIGTGGYVVAPPSCIDGFVYSTIDDAAESQWNAELVQTAEYIDALTDLAHTISTQAYIDGHRDKLIFALSGALRKMDVDLTIAEKIVRYIARDDEELESRITVLRRTYDKPLSEIGGIKTLRDEYNIRLPKALQARARIAIDAEDNATTETQQPQRKRTILLHELVDTLTQLGVEVKCDIAKGITFIDGKPISDALILEKYSAAQKYVAKKYTVPRQLMFDAIELLAHRNTYNSLEERLKKCHELYLMHRDDSKIDVDRLPQIIATCLKAADVETDALKLKHFFTQCIDRALRPGCAAKYALVLTGPQNARKTTACKTLAFDSEYYVAANAVFDNEKDLVAQCRRGWLIELEEAVAVKRTEVNQIKALLSRSVDTVRLPYEKFAKEHPRHFCFIITSNETELLRDTTGNVRYLIIECKSQIDIEALRYYRDIFYGYCYELLLNNFEHQIIPDVCYAQLENYEDFNALEEAVVTTLLGNRVWATRRQVQIIDGMLYFNALAFAKGVFEKEDFGSISTAQLRELTNVASRLGIRKVRKQINKIRQVMYCVDKKALEAIAPEATLESILAKHL